MKKFIAIVSAVTVAIGGIVGSLFFFKKRNK